MNLRQMQHEVETRLLSTQLIQLLMSGQATRDHYRAYLIDVLAYARHSSAVIGHAGSRLVLSHPALAQYLFHHATEELGHDEWVVSDLRDLGMSDAEIAASQPSSACLRMIGLEYLYAMHDNAVGLFGWMFMLESLGGAVGGQIVDSIDRSLDLGGKAVYFLRGHADADSHHSEDLFRVITEHVVTAVDRSSFARMASESSDLYCGMLDSALPESRVERHSKVNTKCHA
jgi:pyrroloquinoline quinone (PQQ) biosynthesis protein C